MKKFLLKCVSISLLLASIPAFAGHPETDLLLEKAKKEAGEIMPQELKKMFDDEKDVIICTRRTHSVTTPESIQPPVPEHIRSARRSLSSHFDQTDQRLRST